MPRLSRYCSTTQGSFARSNSRSIACSRRDESALGVSRTGRTAGSAPMMLSMASSVARASQPRSLRTSIMPLPGPHWLQ